MTTDPFSPSPAPVATDHIHLSTDYRVVEARRGLRWLQDAFGLFFRQPLLWMLVFFVWILIHLVGSLIPFGSLLLTLIGPVFTAGFMIAAAWQMRDEPLDIAYLFAGFRQPGPLIMVGLALLAVQMGLALFCVLAFVVALVVGGVGSSAGLFAAAASGQEAAIQSALMELAHGMGLFITIGLLLVMLLALLLYFLVAFGLSFAPALICLGRMGVGDAIRLSLRAIFANWLPFTLFGLISGFLMVLAILPALLGLLIVMPLLFLATYCAYKDIFPDLEDHLPDD